MVVISVPPFVYLAVEINIDCRRRALLKPYSAAGKPKIGHFGLPAVNQLLAENAKLVAYTIAHCGVTAG